MIGWIILAIFASLLIGLCLIRVGIAASYEEKVFSLDAKVAGVNIQVFPKKEDDDKKKEDKEEKPKKKKEKPEDGKKKKKGLPFGFSKEELFDLIKDLLIRAGRFPRKIRVDYFKLYLLVAGKDPYATARTYGTVNEALSILLPLAKNSFCVKRSSVRTEIDFIRDSMEIEAALSLSIRIGQILGFGLSLTFSALRAFLKSKRRQRKEARAEKKQLQTDPEIPDKHEVMSNNEQIEERKVANG